MSLLFSSIQRIMYSPEDKGSTGVATPSSQSKEDVIEFLGSEDEETIPLDKPKKEVKEKDKEDKEIKEDKEEKEEEVELEEEEEDELKDIEEELEGPTDEQLELVTPVRRKEILKKYPQLFKDFPYLEKAYYREQQFTELLPTIDDAKAAVEAKQTLDKFENEILGGNTENILKAVKEENPKGFYRIVDDYLPTLARVDEKAYYHVISNLSKHTIIAMVQEGKRSNNEALQTAAQILNQFVFGSSDFKPPTNLSKDTSEDKSKDNEINEREQRFVRQQFGSTRDDLNTRVNNTLRNTIEANIDPKQSMTDYVRKTAARDALESLESLIEKDTRFKNLADRLWEKAFEDGFTKTSVDRIKSAYLSKAKTLLPSVIKKARNDAYRGIGKRVRDDSEEESTPNKGPVSVGRPRSQESKSGKITKPEDIPRGMKTLDFLNSD